MELAVLRRGSRKRRTWEPSSLLRPYVTSFELRDDRLGTTRIFSPLPARSDCLLQFHFNQPYLVVCRATGEMYSAPTCVLVGPHTRRREDLIWTGHLKVFTIRFSAIGFRAIFGTPASAIRDIAVSAELVLGQAIRVLEARLAESNNEQMPALAEKVLLTWSSHRRGDAGASAALRLATAIRRNGSGATLQSVASAHSLSLRQVERMFQEFVGLSPKCFERLHRANKALALHRNQPDRSWSSIALASGYFDQAHMIHEFQSLNGSTPQSLAQLGDLAQGSRKRPL